MDRQAAVKIIRDTFENPFDKGRFINFSKNLVNFLDDSSNFVYQGNYIPDAYKPYIHTLERIGKYQDVVNNKIDILIAQLKKETSLERARTMQRNFIAWYLNGSRGGDLKDAALVAFVSTDSEDWRFSLVKMDYLLEESPSGKTKVKTELTPARRFSFLVGENESSHTAQSQLVDILADDKNNPALSTLENAFNIEVATKEFFKRYRELFHKVREELDNLVARDKTISQEFDDKGIDTINFAKKLLGQIVFLYFLQKKGWLGVPENKNWGQGDRKFLRNLFEKCRGEKRNFFNDYLEFLFYDALNTQDRGGIDPSYYHRFDCRIPFLNGGLFNSDYDWVKTDIVISNDIFSNRKTASDEGSGILDIFDLYNFTVKEDEPLEKEVAVDPEMLGKVFENLLEVKDRKSKGTYYTPREIVHYMCQESLINYLDTVINTGDVPLVHTPPPQGKLRGKPDPQQAALKAPQYRVLVPREDIEEFVRKGESTIEHDSRVESIGKETERYSYKLPESIRQNARLIDEKLANIRVCDPAIGSGAFPVGMMHEIIRARNTLTTYFPDRKERTNYNFKRHAIQNCLYGVDIDPGAVEIAKLRLWLSLVVDEEDIRQIKPLPNLDYKIVCGNSLLGVEKNIFNVELFNDLERLKPLHFDETNAMKKQEYKSQIDDLIKQITNNNQNFDFEVYFSEVFHEKGGFDIAIANPPYDVLNVTEGQRISRRELEMIREMPLYKIALGGKLNLYRLFLTKVFHLLNKSGLVTFIIPYGFMCDSSPKKLREFILKEKQIKFVEAFPERDDPKKRLFEVVKMSTCIICAMNSKERLSFPVRTHYSRNILFNVPTVHLNIDTIDSIDSMNLSIPLMTDSDLRIVMRMLGSNRKRIGNIGKCYQGEINLTFHKRFLRKNEGSHAPMVKGAAIQRYLLLKQMSQGNIEFLDSAAFLKSNESPKSKHHLLSRIVMQGITGVNEDIRLKATILNKGVFCAHSINYILVKDSKYSEKYVLSLLNSKLLNWYFKLFSTNSNVNGYEVDSLPIPSPNHSSEDLISLVDRILAITKDADYLTNPAKQAKVKEYERQIDQMVYALYDLTPEEIAVVEGSIK